MKKHIILVLILLIAVISVSGCISINSDGNDNNANADSKGSGNVINKTVNVKDISSVTMEGIGNLTIKQGDNEGLVLTGEDNILSVIKTDVKNDELKIDCPEGMPNPTKELNYELTVKDLKEISMYGSSAIKFEKFKTNKLELNIFGENLVELNNITVNRLISNGYGSFRLKANGTAKEQLITINGLGDYKSENLTTDNSEVTINGCGYTFVSANKELDANINGYGGIYYSNNKINVKDNIFGSGEITTLDKASSDIIDFVESLFDKKSNVLKN
jgi:uncharacterized protein YceK